MAFAISCPPNQVCRIRPARSAHGMVTGDAALTTTTVFGWRPGPPRRARPGRQEGPSTCGPTPRDSQSSLVPTTTTTASAARRAAASARSAPSAGGAPGRPTSTPAIGVERLLRISIATRARPWPASSAVATSGAYCPSRRTTGPVVAGWPRRRSTSSPSIRSRDGSSAELERRARAAGVRHVGGAGPGREGDRGDAGGEVVR